MLRFALQAGITPGDSLVEKFEHLARWGYDGVEIGGWDQTRCLPEVRSAVQQSGVPVVSAIGG
jgi:sugar phosphate isomerase/epimerase